MFCCPQRKGIFWVRKRGGSHRLFGRAWVSERDALTTSINCTGRRGPQGTVELI
jgi:hypothetical protein